MSRKQFITRKQRTNHSTKQPFSINQQKLFSKAAYRNFTLGLFSFLVAFLVASTFAPVHDSDASTVTINNNTSGFFIQITSADDLILNVTASPVGQLAYAADTLNIVTNSPNGYKLYVSTSGNDNNIYQDGDASTSSQGYFGPTTGTISSPVSLAQNTWGFALNKNQDTSYSSAFADHDDYVNTTDAPTLDSTWAAVPTYTNSETAKISELGVANSPSGTDLDIYYGVNASTTLPDGVYSAEITYTAISEGVNKFPAMQDFTAEQCYNMATDTSINLSDARDDKYYRITKMKDGHCWMTDNLALDGTDAAGNVRVLTPSDSNVTANRPLAENIASGTARNDTSIQIFSGIANGVTSECNSAYPYCVVNTTTKYGNLYNWIAATAGVGTASSTGTITESICPKGWRLPDNAGDFSYANLAGKYNLPTSNTVNGDAVKTAQQSPLNFSLAGSYDSSAVYQARGVNYWTHVASSSSAAYELGINSLSGDFMPQDTGAKSRGFSVRCVFAGQSTDLTMQDFTTTMCNNLATDASKVLVDRRNNQFYRVVHAKDGNCWMADNLSIYGQDISATDSDFTSPDTYTIPASITATDQWNSNIYNKPMVEVAHGLGGDATTNSDYYGQVFYNWTTAVAKETTVGVTTAPNTSICPKNWQLPVNGDATVNKSWAKLLDVYGITTGAQLLANSTLGFSLYGFWYWISETESAQSHYGYFWSGTPSSEAYAYYLGYWGSGVNPQHNYYKGYGFSIRCLLR